MNMHNLPFYAANSAWEIADPGDGGAIPVEQCGVCNLVTVGGAQTRTISAPVAVGQWITLNFDTDGGDCVVTSAVALDSAGHTTITFADAGECVRLDAVTVAGSLRWSAIGTDISGTYGPTLS